MTPEQIKARCEEFGETWAFTSETLADLESLYREAMAKGLEMAAEKAMDWREEDPPEDVSIDVWKYFGSQRELLAVRFREQATKLKEPPCDTSSS